MAAQCKQYIDLPDYAPQLVAAVIYVLAFVGIAIAYIIQHRREHAEQQEPISEAVTEEEKLKEKGEAFGLHGGEVYIVENDEAARSPSDAAPSARGVKVLYRSRKPHSRESVEHPPVLEEHRVRLVLDADQTGRAFEFITLLETALGESEFANIHGRLDEAAEDRLCEFLVSRLRAILEESTTYKWLIHGVYEERRRWRVSGLENLLEPGDVRLEQMLRLTAKGPMKPVVLLGFKVDVEMPKSRRSSRLRPLTHSLCMPKTESATQTTTAGSSVVGNMQGTPGPMKKGSVQNQVLAGATAATVASALGQGSIIGTAETAPSTVRNDLAQTEVTGADATQRTPAVPVVPAQTKSGDQTSATQPSDILL